MKPRALFTFSFLGLMSACPLLATDEAMPMRTQIEAATKKFLPVEELELDKELPDPLMGPDGEKVDDAADWPKQQAHLRDLFSHYMYGFAPPAPEDLTFEIVQEDPEYFGGKATKKIVRLKFGPEETPTIDILLVIPNKREAAAPVFLGLNFYGNHTVVEDPTIPLPTVWVPERGEGVVENRATDASRGIARERWEIEKSIDRGYAVASVYNGEIDPDQNDPEDGIQPHVGGELSEDLAPHAWGTIRAWAWGLQRAVDYLVQDDAIDPKRIAVMGHSRNGKTALVAAAFDERIALAVSNQSGCGGAALSRRRMGETVKRINDVFPHWFSGSFKSFNEDEDRLPFDQHALIALIAPRPVLVCSAEEDLWADPEGEFLALKGASPVYQWLGGEGLKADEMPSVNELIKSQLGYHIRPGKHGVGEADWAVFMDFADAQMPSVEAAD